MVGRASPRLCFYEARAPRCATFRRIWRSVLRFIAKTTVPERCGSPTIEHPSVWSLSSYHVLSVLRGRLVYEIISLLCLSATYQRVPCFTVHCLCPDLFVYL
jgi:hypothetical protein